MKVKVIVTPDRQAQKQRSILVLATHNRHKMQEIRAILSERFDIRTLNDFPNPPAVVEDAGSFAGNATKKAVEFARWLEDVCKGEREPTGGAMFVLADDSGLEVDALEGAPGVHSARFAALDTAGGLPGGGNSPDAANNTKLLRLLQNAAPEKRTARFRCVLALVPPPLMDVKRQTSMRQPQKQRNLAPILFEGICEGCIAQSSHGQGGFGYDPLFVPIGYEQSLAELGEEVKNRISHRAKALEKLREWFALQGSSS